VDRRAIERYAERTSRKLALRGASSRIDSVTGVGLRLAGVPDAADPCGLEA
jgi:cell division protein FtsN